MPKIAEVLEVLENFAPPILQEDYDNAGLLTGNTQWQCTGVLCTLDATEAVLDEALAKNCNLVVAHHPIVFRGLKSLTGKNYVERVMIKAIKNDIAIYAIHTNLDNVAEGVCKMMAKKLDLQHHSVLMPKAGLFQKMVVFVPATHAEHVLNALAKAGAGKIGNYDSCSFSVGGEGRFRPLDGSKPYIGKKEELEKVEETRIEVIFEKHIEKQVMHAMQTSHPYETPAFEISSLLNTHTSVGTGLVGQLKNPIEAKHFLKNLKDAFGVPVVRHTALLQKPIEKVALIGGSGSFGLSAAIAAGADVLVTADFKYHEFFDADNKIMVADVGHYESEQFTKELLFEIISEKFTNFALHLSETQTNPIFYS